MNNLYPWQQNLWQDLQQRVAQQRLPHGLLLLGPKGVGKNHLAKTLAWRLLCDHPDSEGLACGQCKSCQLLQAQAHADVRWISPEEDSKEIRIDQIRALSQQMGMTSQQGGNRVAVITPADAMNIKSSNSLLKTLEEPMPGAFLILVTDRLESLPVTLRSRCQLVPCPIPAPEEARRWLSTQGVSRPDWDLCLALTGGAPLATLEWVQQSKDVNRKQRFAEFESLVTGKANPVDLAERWLKDGGDGPIQLVSQWVQDLIRLASSGDTARLQNRDLSKAMEALAQGIALEKLYQLLDHCWRTSAWSRTQANAQLLLEDLLIVCSRLKQL